MKEFDFTVLVVDDDPDIREIIRYNLVVEGYSVIEAKHGAEAVKLAIERHPHLILMDVMMPKMDGFEACRIIRKNPELDQVVIAFLTARGEDFSQVTGFDAGADDYIEKPIKPKVLMSRVKALLRRFKSEERETKLIFENLTIDKSDYKVLLNKEEIDFPRKEFELLVFLADSPGRVFKREEILAKVWGAEVVVGDRTIDVHIRRLREKLGNQIIRTVKGVGYQFVSP
ncbi:MAG TPA: response regulator transcription factor [Flavobacteriaceae bacterium]|nr:response regulator transcription factor [Flavobacteriaceae bacterium]